MRRALRLAACLLGAAPALAQEPAGRLPEGPATLRGRIVHETGGPVAGLPVVLYAAPADGAPGLGRTVSDASGAFAFENLSNAPGLAYLVGVRAEELPFGVRVEFEPGQTLREVEVRIAPPLDDASGVERRAARLRIERGCGGLRVVETHELRNPADRPVLVPESRREGAAALLEIELPAGAGPLSLPFASMGLEQEGARVAFWGPLHPGAHEIEFAYSVPTSDGSARLAWRLPGGVERLEVWTHPDGPRVEGAGLAPGPERTLDGRRYTTRAAGPLGPGAGLELALELPAVAPAALAVREARSWLELDDAALVVDAEYRLAVAGGAPLAADSDAPLLCVSLPPGAEALRFSSETLAMGAEPDPSGDLALRGPIPAGTSVVALRYRVPVAGEAVDLAPRFDRGAGALSVFVADTGIVVETSRLHRRRPIQTADRTFLHLEGFEIEPGESVPLRLARLAPPRPPSRLATLGFSVALAAAGIGFLVGPLRARRDEAAVEPALAELEIERESIVAALRSLEEDFETGKLDASDYEELRGELRARAAELIRRREAAARPRAERPAAAEPACAVCAARLPPDARFCHRCGAAVAGGTG
jgi:hypothetical protein